MKTMNKTLLATAVALASTQSFAAGFQLNSQSATGMGRAFAGDAVIADNASVMARNPAAMAMFDSAAFSGGLTYADVSIEINDVTNISGGIDDGGSGTIIPNIYFINPINEKMAIGVAAFSNFGTGTDSSSLLNNTQTGVRPFDLIGKTEVTTLNFNVSGSYRVNDQLSLGAGLDVIYGEGVLTRNIIPSDVEPLPEMALVDVDATGIAFGAIIGATYELDANNRFGLSYRFSPDVTVDGDISKSGEDFSELTVPLADIFQFAGFHQLTNQFAVHYTAQYTQWGNFEKISLDRIPTGADTDALKQYDWKDSWFLSLGGTYNLNEQITLRAGYAYDMGVVDEISSVSIPDSDRQWFTAGIGYNLTPKSTIDFGIAYIKGQQVSFTEESAVLQGADVAATTESGAMYYSLQYSYKF